MSDRERALLYGVIAGLVCYAIAIHGADWGRADAGLTAAFWVVSVYCVIRKSQEP